MYVWSIKYSCYFDCDTPAREPIELPKISLVRKACNTHLIGYSAYQRLVTANLATILKVTLLDMAALGSSCDLGLVSPEWLQSDASFDAFGEIDELLAGLPDFEATPPPLTSSSCFATTTTGELQRLQEKNVNKNTKKSTNTWLNRLQRWQEHKGITSTLSQFNEQQLDETLQQFYAELRKEDGSDYEPDSLRVMLASLDRHFRANGASYSLLKDKAFERSRQVLNGKAIELRESGRGKRKNKADPLTPEEEELLWETSALGSATGESLNHSLFYTLSQHFGTRGVQEHLQMRLEDFRFVRKAGTAEVEYVEWTEGLTKTRQGGLVKQSRRVTQRVFPSGNDRCSVRMLELLISKRPAQCCTSGPLYLRPLKNPRPSLWYSIQPVGANKIKEFMKTIAKRAGIDKSGKRFTNHSVRKTLVRKLQKGGVSNDKITAITGHKNEQSISDYADTDLEDHQKISLLISKTDALQNPQLPELPASTQPAPLPFMNARQPLQPLQQGVHPPTFVFNDCTVNITCSSTNTMDITQPTNCPSRKRKVRAFIDSDDDD